MLSLISKYLQSNGYDVSLETKSIITTHSSKETTFKIMGILSRDFPRSLPHLYLLERKSFGSLAHVGWCDDKDIGIICEGVSINRHLDYSHPEEIYKKALNDAVLLICDLVNDKEKNETEIVEEFYAHWRFSVKNTDREKVVSFISHSNEIKLLNIFKSHDSQFKGITCLKDEETCLNPEYNFYNRLHKNHQVIGKALYLPLNIRILPPNPSTLLKDWWLDLLSKLPEKQKSALIEIGKRHKTKIFWLLGSIEIDPHNISWFAIRFNNEKKSNFPVFKSKDIDLWKAIPYKVLLHNQSYVKPRGGAKNNNKTVLLIGCGSIGAEIAKLICTTGLVQNLIVVDFDRLDIENIQRHPLAGEYIGYSKKSSLSYDLNKKYPYINIKSSTKSYLHECLDDNFLLNIDGIVIATGSPTEERFFNEQLLKKKKRPWSIYSWVEGHGVGGHAVFVQSDGKGCLSCLFRDKYGEKSLNSIQNFLKSDQEIAVDIAGCGSHFLPYSYIDAVETAVLAMRLITKVINNEIIESCKLSWKGTNDSGLKTTFRFNNFKNAGKLENLYWEQCDICNKW